MREESVKDGDKHQGAKDIVQAPDHGLSGREYTFQTPDLATDRAERDKPK